MFLKIMAVLSLVVLPLSITMWHKSHTKPEQYRYDVTMYKSLRVYLQDGVCGLRLLNMPTKTSNRGDFRTSLSSKAPAKRRFNPIPNQRSFLFRSSTIGAFQVTWLVFPFWASTALLTLLCATPVVRGPVVRQWRRRRGRCVECGYELRGLRSARCPECGTRYR